jgi:hypothetical protein
MKKIININKFIAKCERKKCLNFISSSGSGTIINYGSGSDFLTNYGSGSGSTRQKVTVPVPQHCQNIIHSSVIFNI